MAHRELIAASILTAALLAVPGSAVAVAAHPTGSPQVGATLSTSGQGLHKRIRLKITLNGAPAFDDVVRSDACPPGCTTVGLGTSKVPIRAVALTHFGVPDVVLGLYTGGAHCCYVDQVYRLDPSTNMFSETEHNFADAGARIVDLNGDHNYEFLSADARLANAGFTDFAHSPAPLQIWSFAQGRFHDITRQYPTRLAADAARWLRAFHRQHGNGRGLIAAWAADEELLGHSALVRSELAGALKAGNLGVPRAFGGPKPATFITRLQKLLRRLAYTH